MKKRSVVITGLGAASPLGLTATEMWDNLCNGVCGIAAITAFDPAGFGCKIAGQVPEFKVNQYVPKFHRKAVKLMSRDIELAVVAADDAVKSAGLITKASDSGEMTYDPRRFALNIGAGLISCDLIELGPAIAQSINNGEFDLKLWGEKGMPLVTPLWLLKYLPNMLGCHVGIIHDIQGPGNTITCAEVSGQLAIMEACQIIERGNADVALAGGGEAKVNPIVMIRQDLLKRSTTISNDNPQTACRPFDADASGSVFGEGAGLVIIEALEKAQDRHANIYAQIAGFGESTNLSPKYESLENDGKGIQIAIEKAISDAHISPDEIDLIIPHGTGVPQDDKAEATAIQNALGSCVSKIPVLPTKSMLSNTGAASTSLDVIVACMAIKNSYIPAAKNCQKLFSGCGLNISAEPLNKEIRYALCCGYTFGGQTSAIILKNVNGENNG